jgi:lysophospholipase L1-like esterase
MSPLRPAAILILWLFSTTWCSAVTNINCVGDSITAGVGAPNGESYPAKLQKLLGAIYSVANDGLSGATLLTNGDTPYYGTVTYIRSIAAPKPDIVVIMLGSNDSKSQNWAYGSNFYSNYAFLIGKYTNLTTHPRILLCTPPPVFNNGTVGIIPGIVATNIAPLVRQLGIDFNLQVIDMQSLLAGHGDWFPDNVHPNSKGTSVMAAIVYTALQGDTMNGFIPGLEINLPSPTTAILQWPAGGAGWVLQSTPALGDTNIWSVVSAFIVNNGTTAMLTNSSPGPNAFFRLWNPSTNN